MDKNSNSSKSLAIQQLQNKTVQIISSSDRHANVYKIDPEHVALVIIDMQNFVCEPKNGKALPGIDGVIEKTNQLVDAFHSASLPVIWVRHNINTKGDSTDGGLYPIFHNPTHLRSVENYADSTEIYKKMHSDKGKDHFIFKSRYSAFLPVPAESELQRKLISLNIKQLIVAGVAANVCVESTIRDAMQIDYQIILALDATTTFDDLILEATLTNVKLFLGDVRTSKSIIDEIINNKQTTEQM